MDVPKCTNLLILRGVYPKDFDFIPTAYPENVIMGVDEDYTDMPSKFTSVKDWPKFSNLKCWTCDQIPTDYPKFIAMNVEVDKRGNKICDPHGHFHEWNCAISYISTFFPKETVGDVIDDTCYFESLFSGNHRRKIMPSPPKTRMKQYCGNRGITVKKYNDLINELNNTYSLGTYKLTHFIVEPSQDD